MSSLAQRRIVLGVTGGIAAYKAAELTRELVREGAHVRVVMTRGAQDFVGALTFQALSGERVRTELLDEAAEAAMGHIELARWAELVLIAPASADALARLAQGRADDLLSTVVLATRAPVLVAPAMNHAMWAHPATQANTDTLRERGVGVVGPASGDQACGETGSGRMSEPAALVEAVRARLGSNALAGRSVLVTAGPTHEPLDPVRYLANASSGRMGFAVAEAAARAGAMVTLIAGPTQLATPPGVERVDVTTAAEMHAATMARIAGQDVFVATAAVGDYRPAEAAPQKIKKNGDDRRTLALERNPDILAEVCGLDERPITVGFAAETEHAMHHGTDKRRRKGADLMCINEVGGGRGFGDVESRLEVVADGGRRTLGPAGKTALALELVGVIAACLAGQQWQTEAD